MASSFASLPSLAIKCRSIIVMQIVLMDFHLKIAHVYDFCRSAASLCFFHLAFWPRSRRCVGCGQNLRVTFFWLLANFIAKTYFRHK